MHISFWLTLKHEILHSITKLYFSPMYCQAPLLDHLFTLTVRYSRCVLSTVIDSQAFLLLNADSSIFQWEKHLEQDESKHQAVLLGDHICTHTHSYLSRSQRNSKTQSDDTWFLVQRVTTWDRSQETLTETFQKQDVKTPKNTMQGLFYLSLAFNHTLQSHTIFKSAGVAISSCFPQHQRNLRTCSPSVTFWKYLQSEVRMSEE